jgi:hypothetical protein
MKTFGKYSPIHTGYEIKSENIYIIGIIHGRRDFISTHVYKLNEK